MGSLRLRLQGRLTAMEHVNTPRASQTDGIVGLQSLAGERQGWRDGESQEGVKEVKAGWVTILYSEAPLEQVEMTPVCSLADPKPQTTSGLGANGAASHLLSTGGCQPASLPHFQVPILGRYLYTVPCPPLAESTRPCSASWQAQHVPLQDHPIANTEIGKAPGKCY